METADEAAVSTGKFRATNSFSWVEIECNLWSSAAPTRSDVELNLQPAAEDEEGEAHPKTAGTSSGGGGVSTSTPVVTVDATDRVIKPVGYETIRRADTCEAAGDVRVQGRSQTCS
jgi:hypothetical protein